MNQKLIILLVLFSFLISCQSKKKDTEDHSFNSVYQGEYLNRLASPIGGIGSGMFCLKGTGAISHVSVRNKPG